MEIKNLFLKDFFPHLISLSSFLQYKSELWKLHDGDMGRPYFILDAGNYFLSISQALRLLCFTLPAIE